MNPVRTPNQSRIQWKDRCPMDKSYPHQHRCQTLYAGANFSKKIKWRETLLAGNCISKITFCKCKLWLAKSRVSITVWKTWKGSRHYTPSHTPSRTVFHVLVFYTGYFIKETKNIFSRVPIRCRNTRGSLGELEIAWKHSWKFGRTRNCVETLATSISRSPKLPLVFL